MKVLKLPWTLFLVLGCFSRTTAQEPSNSLITKYSFLSDKITAMGRIPKGLPYVIAEESKSATTQGDSSSSFHYVATDSYGSATNNPGRLLLRTAIDSSSIVSDDFNGFNLKTQIWSFVDPLGDATLTLSGTNTQDAWLSIAVPAGTTHDPWTQGNIVPRIMQPAADEDFEIEVKFESPMDTRFQIQGVLIEQDSINLIRFDFSSKSSSTNVFAATFTNGFSNPVTQISLTPIGAESIAPLYMRVNRTGNSWTISYSLDGTTWTSAGNFEHTLIVRKVGVFAGNAGTDPPHTAVIDYFFNNEAPIVPEDGNTSVIDSIPPLVHNVQTNAGGTSIQVSWKTDEPATSLIQYGTTTSYELGAVNESDFLSLHILKIPGLQNNSLYNFRIISEDITGNKDTTRNFTDTTTTTTLPLVNIFYGSSQTFGKIGVPQRWVNILGNVSDPNGIASLTYSLNDGSPVNLSRGPDSRRLTLDGDFNIDLLYSDLSPGPNMLNIIATDVLGVTSNTIVTVKDSSGSVWPRRYTVNWGSPASLQDSAQVVDGKWAVVAGGVCPVELGYDRLVAIGDTTWDDYEVTAQITVHGLDTSASAFESPSNGASIGLVMRWKGHTDFPVFDPPITQPKSGYIPFGAIGTYRWLRRNEDAEDNRWQLRGNGLHLMDVNTTEPIKYEVLYNFKMRVQTIPDQGGLYSFKAWEDGQEEPPGWFLNGQETLSDPQSGSVLLLAHHVDATFGKITVVPATGATPPTITEHPGNQTVVVGESATFSIAAIGIPPLSYQWQKNNVNISGATSASYTTPPTTRADSGASLHCIVTNSAGSDTSKLATLRVLPSLTRVTDGQQALYTFEEATGMIIHDVSGVGEPLNLAISNGAATSWVEGGLSVNSSTSIVSAITATKIISAAQANSEITIEAWIKPANSDQSVPARIVTLSADLFNRNFTLDQGITNGSPAVYDVRLRTTETSGNGTPSLTTPDGSLTTQLTHFVYTRSSSGDTKIFINGLQRANGTASGDFSNWATTFSLVLANELSSDRPWLGEFHLVAIYDRALTQWEINLNHAAGPSGHRTPTLIETAESTIPSDFSLRQNYPNPFNPATKIEYGVPEQANVTLQVYNMLGKKIITLAEGMQSPGYYAVVWDGRNGAGNHVSSGVYMYRITAAGSSGTTYRSLKKMLLVK